MIGAVERREVLSEKIIGGPLARLRHREGVGPDPSFRLTAWRDGRLTLDDPTTGSRLDLEAFGTTNEGAFARLLSPRSAQP